MKTSFDLIIEKYSRHIKYSEAVIGLFSIAGGFISLLSDLLSSRYSILIISIGLFILLNRLCRYILKAKKIVFETTIDRYSVSTRNIAKWVGYISYSILFIPLVAFFQHAYGPSNKIQHTNLGVIITSFSISKDDDFSYLLFGKLRSDLSSNDSISTYLDKSFINLNSDNYVDSISSIFKNDGFNRGMLVYGKRNKENHLFTCNIYMYTLKINNLKAYSYNENNIYIQNPNLFSFSIDSQAELVSEFIQGLLNFKSKSYSLSKNNFQKAIDLNKSQYNGKFISLCYLMLGNNSTLQANNDLAIKEYEEGLKFDSLNAFIHFNLGINQFIKKDTLKAEHEFNAAKELNGNITDEYITEAIKTYENRVIPNKQVRTLSSKFLTDKLDTLKKGNYSLSDEIKTDTPILHPVADKKQVVYRVHKLVGNYRIVSTTTLGDTKRYYGVNDKKSQIVIPTLYDTVIAYPSWGKQYFIVKKSDKYGALDTDGKSEVDFKCSTVLCVMSYIQINKDQNSK